jgi:hypothetical protein
MGIVKIVLIIVILLIVLGAGKSVRGRKLP